MSDFFVSVLFQAQKEGESKAVTMRKTCLESEAGEVVRQAVELAIASGVLVRGDTVMIQINKIEGESVGHA